MWLLIITFVLSLFIVARIANRVSQEQERYTQIRRAAIAQGVGIYVEIDSGYLGDCYPPREFKPICQTISYGLVSSECLALARQLMGDATLNTCDSVTTSQYFEDGLYQFTMYKYTDHRFGEMFGIEVAYLANIHHKRHPNFILDILI